MFDEMLGFEIRDNITYAEGLGHIPSIWRDIRRFIERIFRNYLKDRTFYDQKTEVPSAVRTPKSELLRTTIVQILRDLFLDSYEVPADGMQESSNWSINYVLTHSVSPPLLDLILAIIFDRWSCMMAFKDAIAYPIASSLNCFKPTGILEVYRAT